MATDTNDDDPHPDPFADDAPTRGDYPDGATIRTPGTSLFDIVAYDFDGDRYCTECISEEYAELARNDPHAIRAGGAVERAAADEAHGPYECGRCGRIIEEFGLPDDD